MNVVTSSVDNPALPSNTGYVAAAYLVFFALVVIYVAVMAMRMGRLEREVAELNDLAARQEGGDE